MRYLLYCLLIVPHIYKSSFFDTTNFCSEASQNCVSEVEIKANLLVSNRNYERLDVDGDLFCIDEQKDLNKNLNMGQQLFGDRFTLMGFSMDFNTNITCQKMCHKELDNKELKKLNYLISSNYKQSWIVDSLPVLFKYENKVFSHFPIGQIKEDVLSKEEFKKILILNHYNFKITFRRKKKNPSIAELIYVYVDLDSFDSDSCSGTNSELPFNLDKNGVNQKSFPVPYTFSVTFIENNNLEFSDRFSYLSTSTNDIKIQWIFISVIIVSFFVFSIFAGTIFVRVLQKDISRYTHLLDNGNLDMQDEYGWKLLQGDVFRPPKFSLILATNVGTGLQIVLMVLCTLFFAMVGLFTYTYRRSLITCLVVLYILFGIISGYVSARLYKFFGGIHWKLCVIGTSFVHPGIIFLCILNINIWLIFFSQQNAIPFNTLFSLFILWVAISAPLSFLGSYIGFRQNTIKVSSKVNHIPRYIPKQPFKTHRITSIVFGGTVPSLCLCIQLYFIMQSIWLSMSYAMFGFLFCTALLVTFICCLISFNLSYAHLSAEDYRWHWRSFFTTGSTAFYCFLNIIIIYAVSNVYGTTGGFMFFSYSLIIIYMLFLATGALGFLSCFGLLLKMYSSIKVD